jgi:transcriptional antiterminator NusG
MTAREDVPEVAGSAVEDRMDQTESPHDRADTEDQRAAAVGEQPVAAPEAEPVGADAAIMEEESAQPGTEQSEAEMMPEPGAMEAHAEEPSAEESPMETPKPEPMEPEPEPMEAEPEAMEAEPEPLEAESEPLEAAPEVMEAAPEPMGAVAEAPAMEAPEPEPLEDMAAEAPIPEAEPELLQEGAEATVRLEEPQDGRQWYVVHCYSGYENKVRHNLEQRIETMNMKDKIFDVVVPTEEEMEVKDGKRRTVERRVFPGYILVQMLMDEDSWYVVRNTPGVTGFVGMGNEPTPLRPEEVAQIVKRMEAEAPRIKVTYKTGQKVRIIDGPFNDFIGTVDNIDMDKAKVRVMVSFFGRETPVELDFLQVEKA